MTSSCAPWLADLSSLADNELPPAARARLLSHLDQCTACSDRLREFRDLGAGLRSLDAPPPPALSLQLRVAASQASVHGQQWLYWKMRCAEMLRVAAVPAVVGTATAAVLLAALAGGVQVRAVNNPAVPDVQVGVGSNPPRVARLANYDVGGTLLVQAQIDAGGHVYGYRVISGHTDANMISRLNEQLLMSVFEPATTVFGQPTTGSLLVSFSTVDVRG